MCKNAAKQEALKVYSIERIRESNKEGIHQATGCIFFPQLSILTSNCARHISFPQPVVSWNCS